MFWSASRVWLVLMILGGMKRRVMGGLKECRDEVIYSTISTLIGALIIAFLSFILYIRIKRKRKKGNRNKGSDIEGRRNKVFENDISAVEREEGNTFKSHSTRRQSLSTPDLSQQKRLAPDVTVKEDSAVLTVHKTSSDKKSKGTQTEQIDDLEDVVVEKKNFNSSGLEFASAGIFIRKFDSDEIIIKEGEIHIGDEVLAINGVQMDGLSDMEVFSHFARSGPSVKLTLSKFTFQKKANQLHENEQQRKQQFSDNKNPKETSENNLHSDKTVNRPKLEKQTSIQNESTIKPQLNQVSNDTQTSSIVVENKEKKNFDINQNIIVKKPPIEITVDNPSGKQHGKSRSAEEHSSTCNGYITDSIKTGGSMQSQNLLVAAARLNKSFDTNGNYFDIQNRYFKRARSEENLRAHKSNSFSRGRGTADLTMSYEEYVRQIALLQANNNSAVSLANDPQYSQNQASILGDKVLLQRGYNQDYITPINGSFNGLHMPLLQQPISRVPPQTSVFTPYSVNGDSTECLDCALNKKLSDESMQLSAAYESQILNPQIPLVKTDDSGFIFPKKENIELDPDVMRYMTQKYSEPRLHRKDPPPYTSTHNTTTQTFSQSNANGVECTVIRRHPQKGVIKQRPHSYTEAANLKKEITQKANVITDQTEDITDPEKRKHPKRAHSMPAVKHLEGRPKVAKTFLDNEDKRKESKRERKGNKPKQDETGRRKSIDSGTLQKLANEIKNDPSLEDEFPFMTKLLGEGHRSPSERRDPTLFRHKSTEELCSQF